MYLSLKSPLPLISLGLVFSVAFFYIHGLSFRQSTPTTLPTPSLRHGEAIELAGCAAHQTLVRASCSTCGHGTCFLGKCFCSAGWLGEGCDVADTSHVSSCAKDECYFHPAYGVPIVSRERWVDAQKAEAQLWQQCKTCQEDGVVRHAEGFNFYKGLAAPVGAYIEIGCGPFTQSQGIFGTFRKDLLDSVTSLTLLDPNIFNYVQHVEKNTFRDGQLLGKRVVLIGGPSEQLPVCEHYDALTVINVAEHVENIYNHLVRMRDV